MKNVICNLARRCTNTEHCYHRFSHNECTYCYNHNCNFNMIPTVYNMGTKNNINNFSCIHVIYIGNKS